MAAGIAVVVAPISLTNSSTTDIKPTSSSSEWIIHNIYIPTGKLVKIYRGNGTNWIELDTVTGSLLAFYFHVTNLQYLKLENVSGDTINVGYDGITSA